MSKALGFLLKAEALLQSVLGDKKAANAYRKDQLEKLASQMQRV